MNTFYILNEQFKVVPITNEIINLSDKSTIRIEPKIMDVLELLLTNPNQLIERKKIVAEVWENYGGADESLNQAISQLRKIFDQVEITYTYQEPIMEKIDRELVIIDQSSSQVEMSKELFENISKRTKLIRNEIIS